ncbi:MAG TPA: hypothetical protein EYQ74_05140 [Planctomycetes bacterium]|nr:hypothetical protein [Planctomycetota bacterium]HIK59950.1 hypothetical protein [Planctomycetota bacterium]
MRLAHDLGLSFSICALTSVLFAAASPALPQSADGDRTVLLIHVDFPDARGPSFSDHEFSRATHSLNRYWTSNSKGLVGIDATVTSLLRMPRPLSYYNPSGTAKGGLRGELMADALDLAETAGYEVSSYDIHWLTPGQGTNGVAGKVWGNNPNSPGIIIHELGHSLNLPHANSWRATDGTTIGPGYSKEYGNRFDPMGGGKGRFERQFNTATKHWLGWLAEDDITTVTQDGIYRIQAHDRPLNGMSAALRIPRNGQQNYWVEFRDRLGDRWSSSGALVMWENISFQYLNPNQTNSHTDLLDMHPATADIRDAPLLPGDGWFDDPQAGIRIRVLGKAQTTPMSLDVEVQFTLPAGTVDSPPSVSFVQPFNNSSSIGGTTVFEVMAYDSDIGTTDGDGIDNVVFEIYGDGSEVPIAVLPPITKPPYRHVFDTSTLNDTGYTVLCRATSTATAGGNFSTDLTYIRVRCNGANRPPAIAHKLALASPITKASQFRAKIVVSDPNGLEDIGRVQGWIATPSKAVVGKFTMKHEGAGVYTLARPNMNFSILGTYTFIARVSDRGQLTQTDLGKFVVK